MNPEVKQAWVLALRSGEYKKGAGRLRREMTPGNYTYCCLGVLCDIYQKMNGKEEGEWKDSYFHAGGQGRSGYPPSKVVQWAGLAGENPFVTIQKESISLAGLNDADDATFEQIADLVEQQL